MCYSNVTKGGRMPETSVARRQPEISDEEILVSLQKVLESKTFSHSATLRHALDFVVKHKLEIPGEPIKEYRVATEVFGRKNDFDPKADNIVRVQMHRLREKLDEYYSSEGQEEPIRILIPRGQYTPEYVRCLPGIQPSSLSFPQALGVPGKVKNRRANALWILIVVLVISNMFFVVSHRNRDRAKQSVALGGPLRSLWQPFFSSASRPLVVFANPAFLVDKQGNLYRYSSREVFSMPMGTRVATVGHQDSLLAGGPEVGPFYYFDSYTGTGELVAATDIARFMTLFGKNFEIDRSRVVSDAQIMENNVIFLGGTKEDRLLGKLPLQQELIFAAPPPGEYAVGSYIKDTNPTAGHHLTYHLQLDPRTGAIEEDYALISLLPNVSVGRYVLDLGGITTLGTQAAAKFVTSRQDIALVEQMRSASGGAKTHSRFFQILLRVNVRDGVPLQAKCILVRELKQLSR